MTNPLAHHARAFACRALATALTAALLAPSALRAQPFDIMEATVASVQNALNTNQLTCRTLVQQYLDRIAAYDKAGPSLNAIQNLNPRALDIADSLDAVQQRGAAKGPLHCVPVLLKDQVETRDMPTTYGSILFKDFIPERDATIVTKLREAGAIILAKTTMGEFASRYVGSAFGIVRNAYDPTRNPSGSSGGSASAVAANMGLVAIGEDTGGSIRGPAAVSNLVGLRPTLQLVSRFGMMPANPTQDVLGPITRTVTDAARMLDVLAGYDPNDAITAVSVGRIPDSYTTMLSPTALRGVRIGVVRTKRDTSTQPRSSSDTAAQSGDSTTAISADSAAARESARQYRAREFAKSLPVMERALADLRTQGAILIDSIEIPTAFERDISNDFETERATDDYLAQHPNAPVKTLKEILLAGVINPWRARGLISYVGKTPDDPDFATLMLQRDAQRVAVLKLMADHQLDAIVYATFDAAPTPIAADVLTNPRPRDDYGLGDNRGLSPALGFPAITVPAGFTSDELPIGLEFLGRPFSERELLSYAFGFEQATRHRRPPRTTPKLAK